MYDVAALLRRVKFLWFLFGSNSTSTILNPLLSPFQSSAGSDAHIKLRAMAPAADTVTCVGAELGAIGRKVRDITVSMPACSNTLATILVDKLDHFINCKGCLVCMPVSKSEFN